jgi:hypothetical protein
MLLSDAGCGRPIETAYGDQTAHGGLACGGTGFECLYVCRSVQGNWGQMALQSVVCVWFIVREEVSETNEERKEEGKMEDRKCERKIKVQTNVKEQ